MRITKRAVAASTAGAVAAGGLGLVLLGAPVASAATTDSSTSSSTGIGDRLQAIADALSGLVSDGTITQEQADAVAETLGSSDALRGPGGPGGHGGGGRALDLDAAAEAVGLSADELRTALQADGATLASVAADEGVEEQTLVDALVAAGEERLQQAVTDGRLTQEQADERIAELPEQVAAAIDAEFRGGPGGGRGGGRPGTGDDTATGGSTTSGSTTSGSTSSGTAV
ncbi:hypothetical protein MO973_00825 [Paenibacillus sp. TRM 82003]|uniref:hypothetical protein n=1 Tax=Kineococcus sp. TRM81007 TaxID=2925831 RepID=UPI001F576100|nr:hypothetical protein [Kineococcus sp. TRM81007]MCI2239405.1 hypothetical protein [Kineococcus sp. TRM81007]MCI3918775.1 hypothetical protein [Paenibacillus sp. TRM 82003]